MIILILKLINSKWPKRLEEANTDTSKKQHLLDNCSATSDDVMLLHKEASKERSSLTKYNKYDTTRNPQGLKRVTAPCVLGNKLLNIQFAKYHIWNNKSEGFPNMVHSTETFNQSVRTEYSEAVNARYTFQPLWVSDTT